MHAFLIVSNSVEDRKKEKNRILTKFNIDKFNQIVISTNDPSIKNVRETIEKLHFKALNSKYKALIIENISLLSPTSQQTLLKTIEEPPENSIIIIETENIDQVPSTITSRTYCLFTSNTKNISSHDIVKNSTFWAKIIKNPSVSQRIAIASELISRIKTKDELIIWIDSQLQFFRILLVKRVTESQKINTLNLNQLNQILRILLFSKKNILGNVNMKLIVDHLFINIPSLSATHKS